MILTGVQVILTLLLLSIINTKFNDFVEQVEIESSIKIEERFKSLLHSQLSLVKSKTTDWSNWDDLYDFTLGKKNTFIEKNINDAYLNIFKMNHILIYSKDKNLIFSRSTYYPWLKWEHSEKSKINYFNSIIKNLNSTHFSENYTVLNDRIIVWALTSITDSQGKLPVGGFLLMAKEIDYKNSKDFFENFGSDFKIDTHSEKLSENVLYRFSKDLLLVQFPLHNNSNEYLANTIIQIPRVENNFALQTKSISFIAFIIMLIVNIFITYILIRNLIITRLTKITSQIPNVLESESSKLLDSEGNDEIGIFSKFFNTSITRMRNEIDKAKEAEINLRHAAQLSSIGEISGIIAHEIKNPLTIILMSTRLLYRDLIKDKKYDINEIKKNLELMEETTKKITNIVNSVSRFSKKDSLNNFHKAHLIHMITDAKFLMTSKLRKNKVDVKIKFHEDTIIYGNPTLLSLVFANLLSNSADALSDQSDPWVEVDCTQVNNFYVITITDSGLGISKEIVDKILNSAFTNKVGDQGTGLGLTFTRKVIKDHNGIFTYDFESTNTRFIIKLPIPDELRLMKIS